MAFEETIRSKHNNNFIFYRRAPISFFSFETGCRVDLEIAAAVNIPQRENVDHFAHLTLNQVISTFCRPVLR